MHRSTHRPIGFLPLLLALSIIACGGDDETSSWPYHDGNHAGSAAQAGASGRGGASGSSEIGGRGGASGSSEIGGRGGAGGSLETGGSGGAGGSLETGGSGGAGGSLETGGSGGVEGTGGTNAGASGGNVQGDPFDPPPDPVSIPTSVIDSVGGEVDSILGSGSVSSATHSILIVDPDTNTRLYERNPKVALKPASNTKLFTTAAALDQLGDDHRFLTEVYADAPLDGAGTLNGNIYLIGQHDFTWSKFFYDDPRAQLDRIAADLYAQGLRTVTGEVQGRGEFVYDGYQYGTYDPGYYRAMAADEFRSALRAQGINVGTATTSSTFEIPSGSTLLSQLRSLPLDVGCSPINRTSHNEFADILMRHIGWSTTGTSSYANGADTVIDWLSILGLDTNEIAFHDGSGLSHSNRVSAQNIVGLMQAMHGKPNGLAWERTFSVGGVRGTLRSRLTGANTVGRFFGKTGTLNGVIATSGLLEHRHLGRRILFGMLMNKVKSKSAARSAHNRIIEAWARDLLASGSRPASPVLSSLKNDGNGATVTATWTSSAQADGYLVWLSADGLVWNRSDARYVTETSHVIGERQPNERVYVRVTALNEQGESDPSDAYGTIAATSQSRILIVDGNDRWQAQPSPENTMGTSHDFGVVAAEAIQTHTFDSAANESVIDGTVNLTDYDAVVWMLGEEGTENRTFDVSEQTKVSAYLEGGGNLFVAGAEIGYDLHSSGVSGDETFYRNLLKAQYQGDDAETYVVKGQGGILADIGRLGFFTPNRMVVAYPDQISTQGGSQAILAYDGGSGGTAGIQFDGAYRLVHFAFPFVSIDNRADRQEVMNRVLAFLAPSESN